MDPEELADRTRNGEVLITHPDLPDAQPAGVMPESLSVWEARGWQRYEAPVDAYDPSKHSVPEIERYLTDATDTERARVLAAEAEGKNRKTIADWQPPTTDTTGADTAPKDKE